MNSVNDSEWLQNVSGLSNDYEARVVEQFTERLIRLAKSKLPVRLVRRCDPEDIVQSVFHSFFQRNQDRRFDIQDANDLWRLLAAMTYKKSMQAIEYHSRKRRDYGRELHADNGISTAESQDAHDDASVSTIAMMAELLGLFSRVSKDRLRTSFETIRTW